MNGQRGRAPVRVEAAVGAVVTLDAGGSRDPDNHTLKYSWFFYPEAGTGIPGQPVSAGGLAPVGGGGAPGEGGIPSAPEGGPREPAPRVTIQDPTSPRVMVTSGIAGSAFIILAVEDNGTPPFNLIPPRGHDDQGKVIVSERDAVSRHIELPRREAGKMTASAVWRPWAELPCSVGRAGIHRAGKRGTGFGPVLNTVEEK